MLCFKKSIFGCVTAGCMTFGVIGCTKLPDGVLDKKEMAELLTDIHKGESVVEMQRGVYSGDSMKKVVKQSILLKHGVTQAQLDTSFVWYGNHIEDYLEIYEDVIKRLEDEQKTVKGNRSRTPVFAEGDSIDIWPLSHTYKLSDSDILQNINFEIARDSTWRNGDNYILQFKCLNTRQQVMQAEAVIYAVYDDGRVEFRPSSTMNNWVKVRLVTDSMSQPISVFGSISYQFEPSENVYIDSVSLVRTRNRKDTYSERNGQRTFTFPKIAE